MKKPLNELSPALRRWLWRSAIAAAALSLIGLTTHPSVTPLLCKIYG
ncbi:MAG: hypothetical protein ACK4E4_01390 [Rhodocyclaceae bacterium]